DRPGLRPAPCRVGGVTRPRGPGDVRRPDAGRGPPADGRGSPATIGARERLSGARSAGAGGPAIGRDGARAGREPQSAGAGPVDARTTSWTGTTRRSAGAGGTASVSPSSRFALIRAVSVATAQRPISADSWRSVVSAGSTYAAKATSSKPTRLTSAGTRSPRSRIARIAPI